MGKVIKFPERKPLTQDPVDVILAQVDEILAQADRINEQTEALIAFMEKKDEDCE
jgi:hypothetical protein